MNDPHEIINNLSPEDAFAILRLLAAQDEKLAAEIAALQCTTIRSTKGVSTAKGSKKDQRANQAL